MTKLHLSCLVFEMRSKNITTSYESKDTLMVQSKFTLRLFALVLIFSFSALGQSRIIAPVERNGYTKITSYDTLQAFLSQIATVSGFQIERIALTRQGRSVAAVHITADKKFGADPKKLRVMIHAQQHGDEPSGKEAMTLLLSKIAAGEKMEWLKSMDIIIVPQMNPDGAELRQRRTSDLFDMNRNHLILTLPEPTGLHDLFWKWKPEVTMDVHEYTTSNEWRDAGMVRTGDVLLGTLTHPNTAEKIREMQHNGHLPFIAEAMKKNGFRFHEYIVGSPETRLRQSTTEINDGRQSFGILGTMSFIQEGLKWGSLEDSLRRRTFAQLTSVEAFLEYCSRNAGAIRSIVQSERTLIKAQQGKRISLRTEREVGPAEMSIPVFNIKTKSDTVWKVTPYQSVVVTHLSGELPAAYVVPKHLNPVIDLLKRHHVTFEMVKKKRTVQSEVFTLDSIAVEIVEEDPKPKPVGRWETAKTVLFPGDVIVRTDQLHAVFLSIALEPESVWGLIGYAGYDSLLSKPGKYPIAKLIQ
jgi:hypothetical protein